MRDPAQEPLPPLADDPRYRAAADVRAVVIDAVYAVPLPAGELHAGIGLQRDVLQR